MSEQSVFPQWKSFLGKSGDEETKSFIKNVVKRSGDIVSYDRKKIEKAIGKAIQAVEKFANPDKAAALTDSVEEKLLSTGFIIGFASKNLPLESRASVQSQSTRFKM